MVEEKEEDLLTITTKGYGKRTPVSEYRRIKRGGKGVKNIRLHPKLGEVICIKKVKEEDEILIITRKGKSIRLWVKNIRRTGRLAMGTRIIRVAEDDEVIAVT